MLGPSGVGKSALTVALTAGEVPATGALSDARLRRGRGRHTTVQSRVFPLRGGGFIIDTAGIRSLALPEGAHPLDAFPEIEQLAQACRFPDCSYQSKPGCAVRAAAATGQLPPRAYEGYLRVSADRAARPAGRGYAGPRGERRRASRPREEEP